MGQVPSAVKTHFLLIGSGRLAHHLRHYFQLLGLSYSVWSRQEEAFGQVVPLEEQLVDSDVHVSHLLWAISDGALQSSVDLWSDRIQALGREVIQVHFSGSRVIRGAHSAHPLMTFPSDGVWDLPRYRRIPFALSPGGLGFADLFPGLPNPSFEISDDQKSLYHAYCVMAGNFTTLLWQSIIQRFESQLKTPREILFPYLDQTAENLKLSAESALTGPLIRNDLATVEKNLQALDGDPMKQLYVAFRDYFYQRKNL